MAQCPECDAQIMVPMNAIGAGMVVGNFKLLRKLGTGGMGDVYLAEQSSLERKVALKVLPPAMTRDQNTTERFLQEMRNQAALNHPNIATAFDAGQDRDIYYLAMEYVEGVDLARILDKRERLPEREALRIALEVARGLDYAWYKRKIIHRDIKPGNIIISKDAEVRILDMGLSRSMTEMVDLSGTNYLVGTPLYMSPEQIDSDTVLDFRTDMYSLGTTLYHMLTGVTPYAGKTVTQILGQRATKDPPSIRQLNPDVSEGCAAVVRAMMARKRDERFADWPAVMASINQALDGYVPLTPLSIAAAQKAQSDSGLTQAREKEAVEVEGGPTPAPEPESKALPIPEPVKNPMIPVYLAGLGVVALALATALIGFLRMKPRIITVEVPVEQVVQNSVMPVEPGISGRLDPANNQEKQELSELSTNSSAGTISMSAEEEAILRKEQEDERARDEVQALYDFSVENLLKSPEDFDPHVEAFTQVMKEAERLELFTLKETAAQEIDRLRKLKRDRIENLLARLQDQATVAIDAGAYEQAALLVREYDGPMMSETLTARKTLAASVAKKAASVRKNRMIAARRADVAYAELLTSLTQSMVSNQQVSALGEMVQLAKADELYEPIHDKVYQLEGLVNLLLEIEQNVLSTFRTQIGKTIEVEFLNETKTLVIKSVEADEVMASQLIAGEGVGGTIGFAFNSDDLSMQERLARITEAYGDQSHFVLGFMALQGGNLSAASQYFKKTENDLASGLLKEVDILAKKKEEEDLRQAQAALEREARWAFANVLHSARLPMGIDDEQKLLEVFGQSQFDEDRQRVVSVMADAFREKYGSTELAHKHRILLRQLSGETFREMSVDELKRDLVKHNAEYNGGGLFETNTFSVVKIDLDGSENVGDLRALKDLPVQALRLSGKQVRNIDPLKGMPLRSLVLKGTAVKDLSPIRGMPLESLSLEDTQGIREIGVLQNARLRSLNIKGTEISNLKPIAGQPIEQLLVSYHVKDISPLVDMPLTHLSLSGSKVRNLSALQGKPLEFLDLLGTPVEDVSALEGMPLKVIKLHPQKIRKGLDVLRAMPSLEQFQTARNIEPISREDFWKLVDDGTFVPDSRRGTAQK